MNKQRREKIRKIKEELEISAEKLRILLDEEQNYYDNMPENLQSSLRASYFEDAIDILEECIEYLENVIDRLIEI